MADQQTTTYNLTKPEIGASQDSWGSKVNANFDELDNLLDGTTVIDGGPKLDSSASIVDATDNTKIVQFDVSGVTTATTRTLTVPDDNITLVGTAATQTLTNKTLASPTISGPTFSGAASGSLDLSGATVTYGTALEALDGSSITGLSGSDVSLITGTAGANGNLAQWNADGDVVDGPDVLDEDNMASNSASAVPTQQSVKAYVDALELFGDGQTWSDVSGSRSGNTSYQNTTGRTIGVSVRGNDGSKFQVSSNNSTWVDLAEHDSDQDSGAQGGTYVIPPGYYYRINGTYGGLWAELR